MTAEEIRKQVSPMIIWVADAAIREARKGITNNTGWKDIKRSSYNLPEVEMAGEILFRMFEACTACIRLALIQMPEKMDGVRSFSNLNYFDEFVKSINARESVKLRETDWILDLC